MSSRARSVGAQARLRTQAAEEPKQSHSGFVLRITLVAVSEGNREGGADSPFVHLVRPFHHEVWFDLIQFALGSSVILILYDEGPPSRARLDGTGSDVASDHRRALKFTISAVICMS
jgi:hypothetical protein